MRAREFTINVPITIKINGDEDPDVSMPTQNQSADDDTELQQNPVMVSPQQQELELKKADLGKIMRSTDIIRTLLDLIDTIETEKFSDSNDYCEEPGNVSYNDEERKLHQILDLLQKSHKVYDNSPDEVVAGIASVTTDAGGGWNGPKNPADMRSDSVSLYPNHIHKPGA